jgi:hypothetical protein
VRLITMDLAKKDENGETKPRPAVFINPEIISSSEELSVYEEGCLSIPEYYEEVERPAQVRIRFTDLDGKVHEEDADGPVRHLHPARDRPPQRRAVRGLSVEAEARPRAEEVYQGRQTRGGVIRDSLKPSWPGSSRPSTSFVPEGRTWMPGTSPGMTDRPSSHGFLRLMPLRLIFMGTPDFAVPTLLELVAHGHEVVAVYTRAAKPAGRGMKLQPTPVEQEARRLGIPVLTPTTLKSPEALAEFRAHNADAAVVVAYGMILPQAILDAPPLGCFNLHASLLPRWRGAARSTAPSWPATPRAA